VTAALPAESALQATFVNKVVERFRLMVPMVEFLNQPLIAEPARIDPHNLSLSRF
jgi:hypothetical protein